MATRAFAIQTAASNAVVTREDLVNRARSEYLEMPGLRLTPAQAARLWGLEPDLARTLLKGLVEASFLVRTSNGAYGLAARREGR